MMYRVKIIPDALVARIAAFVLKSDTMAITFGNSIYLHSTTREEFINNIPWLCHELAHVNQYRYYGFARFIYRYVLETIRKGYTNNRFEIEARSRENDISLLEGIVLI